MRVLVTVRRTSDDSHVCDHKLASEEEMRNLKRLYPWPEYEFIEENW